MLRLLLLVGLVGVAGCGDKDTKLKVTSIDPDTGDYEGGTYIKIRGNRFLTDANGDRAPANAKIYFGSRQGTVSRFVNDEEMIVEAPGGKPNEVVDVLIIFEGRGEIKIPKGFTFVEKNKNTPTVNDLDTSKKK